MGLIKVILLVLIITAATVGVFIVFKPDLTSYAKGLYLYNQGNLAYRRYDYPTAKDYYLQAVDYHPEPEKVYLRLGDTEFHMGNEAEALQAYQKALELEPHMKEAVIKIAQKEWEYGHRKIALAMYRNALDYYPDDKTLNLKLADLYMEIARDSNDADAYDNALEIYSRFAENDDYLQFKIGEALYAQGKYKKALGIYCDLAVKYPRSPEALSSLALTLGQIDAYNDAYKTMVNAAELVSLRDDELALKWNGKALDFQHQRNVYDGLPDDQVFTCMQRIRLAEVEFQKSEKE